MSLEYEKNCQKINCILFANTAILTQKVHICQKPLEQKYLLGFLNQDGHQNGQVQCHQMEDTLIQSLCICVQVPETTIFIME